MIELKHIERFYPLAKGQFFYVLRDVNLKIEESDFVSIRKAEGSQSVILAWSSFEPAVTIPDHNIRVKGFYAKA